jgi:isocitrate dehydrogenase kinase/phosphatase
MLDGFETHDALMRQTGRAAKGLFEARDWNALRRLQSERIGWYDTRVAESVERLTKEFAPDVFTDAP